MQHTHDPLAPKALLCCGLAAVVSYPAALLTAVCCQAVGAMTGGCQWIGLSLAPHRPVWALVNQPTLDFASRPNAIGYWFGSSVGPMIAALVLVALVPRPRWLAAELTIVQVGWVTAVVGGGWLPLLEPGNSHLGLYLKLSRVSPHVLWLAPALASLAAIAPTLRLLALLHAGRPHAGRMTRSFAVALFFGLPLAGWCFFVSLLRVDPPLAAMVASLCPLAVGFAIAWYGHPRGMVHQLAPVGWPAFVVLLIAGASLCGLVFAAGQPVDTDRSIGVIWATPNSFNNIRDWIEPIPVEDRTRDVLDRIGGWHKSRSALKDCRPPVSGCTMMNRLATAGQRTEDHTNKGDFT